MIRLQRNVILQIECNIWLLRVTGCGIIEYSESHVGHSRRRPCTTDYIIIGNTVTAGAEPDCRTIDKRHPLSLPRLLSTVVHVICRRQSKTSLFTTGIDVVIGARTRSIYS